MSKQASATRLIGTAALAALLGTIAAPSFAGNYAEGDPRPRRWSRRPRAPP